MWLPLGPLYAVPRILQGAENNAYHGREVEGMSAMTTQVRNITIDGSTNLPTLLLPRKRSIDVEHTFDDDVLKSTILNLFLTKVLLGVPSLCACNNPNPPSLFSGAA